MKETEKSAKDAATPRSGRRLSPVALQAARDRAIDALSECFAQDRCSLEEFERRVTRAQEARSISELRASLEGLARPPEEIGAAERAVPARSAAAAPVAQAPASEEDRVDQAVAVFGETKRVGSWTPARQTRAAAVMGSVVIDLREARFGPGDVLFNAVTFFGTVEFIVPPDLQVECAGSALFGSFEHGDLKPEPWDANAPTVRIDGFATFGSVDVEVRNPGESKREAKRRRRAEKKRRRRARKARRRG